MRVILTAVFVFAFFFSFAQEPIQTDRPDQTESPAITPKAYIQMEHGFMYEQADKHHSSATFPSLLTKLGLSPRLELRLITELVSETSFSKTETGLTPVTIGFKTALCEEKGLLPKTSFIGHLTLPTFASKKFKAVYYAPAFRFTMQHTLSDKINLGYNLGAEWDGETPEPSFIYTLTTGFSLGKKTGAYVEVYGFAPQHDKADHRLDGGFTYLLNKDFQFDLSGGVGLTENAPDYYGAVGVSYRFAVRK